MQLSATAVPVGLAIGLLGKGGYLPKVVALPLFLVAFAAGVVGFGLMMAGLPA